MLSSILDANITKSIVRLGRRADERLKKYSIETLERVENQSRLDRSFSNHRRQVKEVEDQIRNLMAKVLNLNINTGEIMEYLSTFYPEHFEYLSSPPLWVSSVKGFVLNEMDGAGEWQTAGRGGKACVFDQSTYAFWRDCSDLAFIGQVTNGLFEPWKSPIEPEFRAPQNAFSVLEVEVPDNNHSSDEEELSDTESVSEEVEVEESWKTVQLDPFDSPIQVVLPETSPPSSVDSTEYDETMEWLGPADIKDMDGFFDSLGFERTPSVPHSDRPLDELLEDVGNVWEMSAAERQKVHILWAKQARTRLGLVYLDDFKRLRKLHAAKLRQYKEGQEEVCGFIYRVILEADVYQIRRNLLHYTDIIGCTTTGHFFPFIN